MLQDTHIHIQDIKDNVAIEQFLTGVSAPQGFRFFDCAITPADWPIIRKMADAHKEIVPFFGVHPWFGDILNKGWEDGLASYLSASDAFAGEMGLDKARKNIDIEIQKEVFSKQLIIARRFNKPFAVHCVRAWAETIALIKDHAPGLKFLLHSFNGSKEIAQEILAMGGYVSCSAKALALADETYADVFRSIPAERVLIETDFPYQIKWSSAEDYVKAVSGAYLAAAKLKDMPLDEFIRKIHDNGTVFTDRTAAR
jgi:TatD DNase family protein